MYVGRPNHITKRSQGAGTSNEHTLTDEEYAQFLALIETIGYEPLTDTDGRVITHTSGEILYGKI